jgi:hypothetical protein
MAVMATSPIDAASRPRRPAPPPGTAEGAAAVARSQHEALMAKKAAVEALQSTAGAAIAQVAACCASPAGADQRNACRASLAVLESERRAARWAYHTGNYDEAKRIHIALEAHAKAALQQCERTRASVERCVKLVQAARERLARWASKIEKLKDPASKAAAQEVHARSERAMTSLERSCSTSETAAVIQQIGPAMKPLDDALRKAR